MMKPAQPYRIFKSVYLLLLISALLVPYRASANVYLPGCTVASAYDATLPTAWMQLSLQLVRQTPGYSPPVAARAFGYIGVTLYEAVVPGMPDYQSLAGRLNGLHGLPKAPVGVALHWPTVANAALASIIRQIQSGGSLGAGNDLAVHFGLGNATQVEQLEIEWPSGVIQILTHLPNVLYLNQGNGTFTGAPPAAGVADEDRSWGVIAADVDSDDDLDLYVSNLAQPNTLYLNQGDGTFQNGTAASGLGNSLDSSTSAAVADFNGDGSLDLVVANTGKQDNALYLNDGAGHFQPATDASGIDEASNSVAVATADFNNDGSADLYVVNANLPDQLYLNNRPNGAECWP